MDQVTPRDLRTRGRRPSRTATAGVFRASDGSGTHVPRRSAGRCGMEVWLRRAEPSSELGYYERRAGRRRTSGWCTWQSLQRELVCGSGAAACAAQTTSPASRPVQSGPSPSPASARGRAVDSGRGCPAGRVGPSSDSPHHLRRAILLIRLLAGGQGRRVLSSEAKQRPAQKAAEEVRPPPESRRAREKAPNAVTRRRCENHEKCSRRMASECAARHRGDSFPAVAAFFVIAQRACSEVSPRFFVRNAWNSSSPIRLRAERTWIADMKPGRHVPFLERPDEDAPAQTKTNNKLANKHAGLREKTANLKQARRVCLCSPR